MGLFGEKWYAGRRSYRLGPVRINTVWFLPTSVSVGAGPGRVNVGRSGRTRTSIKIPGLGGTWQRSWGRPGSRRRRRS